MNPKTQGNETTADLINLCGGVGKFLTRGLTPPRTSTKKQDRQLAYMRKIKEAPEKPA